MKGLLFRGLCAIENGANSQSLLLGTSVCLHLMLDALRPPKGFHTSAQILCSIKA